MPRWLTEKTTVKSGTASCYWYHLLDYLRKSIASNFLYSQGKSSLSLLSRLYLVVFQQTSEKGHLKGHHFNLLITSANEVGNGLSTHPGLFLCQHDISKRSQFFSATYFENVSHGLKNNWFIFVRFFFFFRLRTVKTIRNIWKIRVIFTCIVSI